MTPTKRALESLASGQKPNPKRRPAPSSSSLSPAPGLLNGDQWVELLANAASDDGSRQCNSVEPPKTKTIITLIRIAKCNLLPDQWTEVVGKLESQFPRLEALSRDATRYGDLLTDINAKEEKHLLGLLFGNEYQELILAIIKHLKHLKWGQGHAVPVLAAVLTVYWGRIGEHQQVTVKEALTYFGRMEKKHGYYTTDHFWEGNGGRPWPIAVAGRKREGLRRPPDAVSPTDAPKHESADKPGAAAAAAPSPSPSTPISSMVKKLSDTKLESPAHQQTAAEAAGGGYAKPEEKLLKGPHIINRGVGASGICKGFTMSPMKRIAEEDETPTAPGPEVQGAEQQEKEEEEGEQEEEALPSSQPRFPGFKTWGGTSSSPPREWAPGSQDPADLLEGLSQDIEDDVFPVEPPPQVDPEQHWHQQHHQRRPNGCKGSSHDQTLNAASTTVGAVFVPSEPLQHFLFPPSAPCAGLPWDHGCCEYQSYPHQSPQHWETADLYYGDPCPSLLPLPDEPWHVPPCCQCLVCDQCCSSRDNTLFHDPELVRYMALSLLPGLNIHAFQKKEDEEEETPLKGEPQGESFLKDEPKGESFLKDEPSFEEVALDG